MIKQQLKKFSKRCLKILLKHRTKHGSFLASISYPWYNFSWLRDNYWCASSLDIIGQNEEAEEVYLWMDKVISKSRKKISELMNINKNSPEFYSNKYHIGACFNPDGSDKEKIDYGYRQYDGPALFLIGLTEHIEATGNEWLIDKCKNSIDVSIDYLSRVWDTPCFDVWEEFGSYIHSYDIGVILAAFRIINRFVKRKNIKNLCKKMNDYLLKNFVKKDVVKKMRVDNDPIGIDASSLWMFTKFNILELGDRMVKNTVKAIQKRLGDVAPKRYFLEKKIKGKKVDTYYGGGRWLPLACALGEYYLSIGSINKAMNSLLWCYFHRTEKGFLPEQSVDEVFDKNSLGSWTITHKGPACPLAWSHASFLTLYEKLKEHL
jgi:GH15 family glucan-1,4-alpha-glucosidase